MAVSGNRDAWADRLAQTIPANVARAGGNLLFGMQVGRKSSRPIRIFTFILTGGDFDANFTGHTLLTWIPGNTCFTLPVWNPI